MPSSSLETLVNQWTPPPRMIESGTGRIVDLLQHQQARCQPGDVVLDQVALYVASPFGRQAQRGKCRGVQRGPFGMGVERASAGVGSALEPGLVLAALAYLSLELFSMLAWAQRTVGRDAACQ